MAVVYEALLTDIPGSGGFVFVSRKGRPWHRDNFRQRYWRPAWDGIKPDDPNAKDHMPPILTGFTFHEGRHTHSTWLVEAGIPEVARKARLGHKMPGIARVYEHVTSQMEQAISDALEARWEESLRSLTGTERTKLVEWVPALKGVVDAATSSETPMGDEAVSQISPTDRKPAQPELGQFGR